MKILNLQAENIKKLTAIDITPKDNMIMITGPNGAGKSSILDCIVMALKGGREIPEVPIKKGADKGKIVLDMGDYRITRSFTKENSYLKIDALDGEKIKSPQAFLDKIVGNVSFDPLAFLNNDTKKQRNILLEILGVNVDELDKQEKDLREKRTIVGRDVEKTRAIYQGIPHFPDIKATKEVGVDELSTQLMGAIEFNTKLDRDTAINEQIKQDAQRDINEIAELENQIKKLKSHIEDAKKSYRAEKERLSDLSLIDITEIQSTISQLSSTNEKIRANIQKKSAQEEYDTANQNYISLTTRIDSIAQKRKDLLSSATMPVDGLSFDENGLLYNDIPLDQASDGEKLMVSLAISMALNPTCRVLRIKDGSLLDDKNRAIIAQMIKDKDYQLWFESVGSDSKVGIYIEEGRIVNADTEKPKKKAITKEEEAW